MSDAVAVDRQQTNAFLAVLAGATSPQAFFGPTSLRRLLGWRGLLALAAARDR